MQDTVGDAEGTAEVVAPIKGLCAYLVDLGKLNPANAERALRLQLEQDQWEPIGSLLVKLGLVSEKDVAESLSNQLDIPLVERKNFPDQLPIDSQVPRKFLKEHHALILDDVDNELLVVMADPRNHYVAHALTLLTGKAVQTRLGILSEIEIALGQRYEALDSGSSSGNFDNDIQFMDDVEQLKELASEAPVIKLVNQLIHRAVEADASDIHVEPFEGQLKVRYRIDGLLREVDAPPTRSAAAVVSRVKIMANLNIAERRLPQDGRFNMRVSGSEIDLRVSTVPTMYGERVVMRLLHRNAIALDFRPLGFSPELERALLEILALPHGILLVTGPTGSGKSTTLYAALKHLNSTERMIITVEDPVEYNIEGINQIQVKPQIGLDFANTLRSIVRQDPDVIMIGEMRDEETARIAVQSALTGHLVLSTLHTNDAAGSITRLLDMGVEDYLLTSTVNAVLAQRLVRRLCTHCREPYRPPGKIVERWQLDRYAEHGKLRLFRAVGCEHCGQTGYTGRSAIIELMVMNEALRSLLLSQKDASEIARQAAANGMQFMFEDGLRKAVAGMTTIEEVLRVSQEQCQSTIADETSDSTAADSRMASSEEVSRKSSRWISDAERK